MLEESEACGILKGTVATAKPKPSSTPVHIDSIPYAKDLAKEKAQQFPGINTIYFNLYYPTQDVQLSTTTKKSEDTQEAREKTINNQTHMAQMMELSHKDK